MNNFDFLVINYNLNQKYFIEKNAIEKVVDYVFSRFKKIILLDKKILIEKDGSDFEVKVRVQKQISTSIYQAISRIEEQLNFYLFNLCTYKAKNIQIVIVK